MSHLPPLPPAPGMFPEPGGHFTQDAPKYTKVVSIVYQLRQGFAF